MCVCVCGGGWLVGLGGWGLSSFNRVKLVLNSDALQITNIQSSAKLMCSQSPLMLEIFIKS